MISMFNMLNQEKKINLNVFFITFCNYTLKKSMLFEQLLSKFITRLKNPFSYTIFKIEYLVIIFFP